MEFIYTRRTQNHKSFECAINAHLCYFLSDRLLFMCYYYCLKNKKKIKTRGKFATNFFCLTKHNKLIALSIL